MDNKTVFGLLLFVVGINTAFAVSTDEDGCFQAPNHCVSMDGSWRGDKFTSYYTNTCNARLYIRFCNERGSGSDDCGADGLRPGKRKSWTTYNDPNGRYSATWVGSTIPSKDWVCAGKVAGWGD